MGNGSKAIKWSWRHYSRQADVYDSLDEAIESAILASDMGAEAFDCIEYGGERIGMDDPRYEAIEQKRRAEDDAEREARPKATHRVQLQHPDGEWMTVYGVTMPLTESTAGEVAEFTSVIGAGRVRVGPIRT